MWQGWVSWVGGGSCGAESRSTGEASPGEAKPRHGRVAGWPMLFERVGRWGQRSSGDRQRVSRHQSPKPSARVSGLPAHVREDAVDHLRVHADGDDASLGPPRSLAQLPHSGK